MLRCHVWGELCFSSLGLLPLPLSQCASNKVMLTASAVTTASDSDFSLLPVDGNCPGPQKGKEKRNKGSAQAGLEPMTRFTH